MATNIETDRVVGRTLLTEHWTWYLYLSAGLLFLSIFRSKIDRSLKLPRLPLPPGPRGMPLLGNTLQVFFDKRHPWMLYHELAREYAPNGDMVYLDVAGQPILVLNSAKVANVLLERRGAMYADRSLPLSAQMLRVDWSFAIISYGPRWRAYRRMFHQYYNKTQIPKYTPIIEAHMLIFLRRLLSSPRDFMEDTRYLFGGIIIEISYGSTSPSDIASMSNMAEAIVKVFADCLQPGHFLVDIFPFLQWTPTWLPGAAWKRRLLNVAKISDEVLHRTFDDAKARVNSSEEVQDYVAAKIIANLPSKDDARYAQQEEVGRGTALAAYVAGSDTTVSSAHALFLALANHPECHQRAQDELDRVIGNSRVPTVADLPQLPYVQALVKELSRWFSVTPMGIPHTSHRDDTYEGYFIPKGTTVIANSWAIMHDPEVFDNPLEFNPNRYLMQDPETHQLKINPAVPDPETAAFGFGRRICPGRHLSTESLTLMAASMLSVFNVTAPKDVSGKTTKLPINTVGRGTVITPAPFNVDIVPRSAHHAALILREGE